MIKGDVFFVCALCFCAFIWGMVLNEGITQEEDIIIERDTYVEMDRLICGEMINDIEKDAEIEISSLDKRDI